MTAFTTVAIYNLDGSFVGYSIMGANKLQSTNIYREGEEAQLNEQLGRLNNDVDLRAHWPHPQDPEVVALLNDTSFMPISYVTAEVVDDENSYYVYKKRAAEDPQTGQPVWADDENEVDEDASVIVMKTAQVPERPTDVMWRIKKACEAVAKRRSGLYNP